MKSFIYTILILSFIGISFADDWDIVRDDGLYSYVKDDSTISVIKITGTSQTSSGKSLLNIFSPELVQGPQNSPRCVIERGSGWLGRYVLFDNDGTQLLVNKNKDTIRFRPKAKVGDTWKMMYMNFGRELRATIGSTSNMQLPVLNISDSVKIIDLAVYDENGNILQGSPLNNKHFYLSKKYGLVRTFNIFNFPDSLDYLLLSGINGSTQLGIKPITIKDVFNFEIGDEFHIFEGDTMFNQNGDMTWRRLKILDKTYYETENMFDYEVDVKLMQIAWEGNQFDTVYTDNIANLRIELNNYPDYLPDESYLLKNFSDTSLSSNKFYVGEYGNRQVIRPGKIYRQFMLPCFIGQNPQGDIHYSYIEGCGEFYEQDYFYGQVWKRLMYYNKSGKEYGKKLDFVVGVADSKNQTGVRILPNPAKDYIDIFYQSSIKSGSGSQLVVIYDLLGVEVLKSMDSRLRGNDDALPESQIRLDVSGLAQGIYFVRFGNVVSKFVKL